MTEHEAKVELTQFPMIHEVQVEAASYYGISRGDLMSTRRATAKRRQVAMYVSKVMTDKSLPQIGRAFGRDHTTILHAVRQTEKRRQTDPDIEKAISAIICAVGAKLVARTQALGLL